MAKIASFRGRPVVDRSGARIGTLDDYYKDDVTGRPLWLKVKARWLHRSYFVASRGARPSGDSVIVAFDSDVVRRAPVVGHEGSLTPAEDAVLEAYYNEAASPQ
jgi:uncharacterized protein YrrD